MKPRSYAISGLALRYIGSLLGIAVMTVAIFYAVAAGCLLVASERED